MEATRTTFRRISKATARKMWEAGETFAVCPRKLRPGFPWAPQCYPRRDPDRPEETFERMLAYWAHYNTSWETGYYAAFYVEE